MGDYNKLLTSLHDCFKSMNQFSTSVEVADNFEVVMETIFTAVGIILPHAPGFEAHVIPDYLNTIFDAFRLSRTQRQHMYRQKRVLRLTQLNKGIFLKEVTINETGKTVYLAAPKPMIRKTRVGDVPKEWAKFLCPHREAIGHCSRCPISHEDRLKMGQLKLRSKNEAINLALKKHTSTKELPKEKEIIKPYLKIGFVPSEDPWAADVVKRTTVQTQSMISIPKIPVPTKPAKRFPLPAQIDAQRDALVVIPEEANAYIIPGVDGDLDTLIEVLQPVTDEKETQAMLSVLHGDITSGLIEDYYKADDEVMSDINSEIDAELTKDQHCSCIRRSWWKRFEATAGSILSFESSSSIAYAFRKQRQCMYCTLKIKALKYNIDMDILSVVFWFLYLSDRSPAKFVNCKHNFKAVYRSKEPDSTDLEILCAFHNCMLAVSRIGQSERNILYKLASPTNNHLVQELNQFAQHGLLPSGQTYGAD
jgi:hypothetical protein